MIWHQTKQKKYKINAAYFAHFIQIALDRKERNVGNEMRFDDWLTTYRYGSTARGEYIGINIEIYGDSTKASILSAHSTCMIIMQKWYVSGLL